MSNLRDHFNRHKTVYVCAGTAVAFAGITCLIMKGSFADVPRVSAPDVPRVSGELGKVQANPFTFALFMKNSGNVTASLHTGTKGHPGFITRCLETGDIFQSQNKAAEAFGVTDSILSGHLNGKLTDVNGYHFERVFVQ